MAAPYNKLSKGISSPPLSKKTPSTQVGGITPGVESLNFVGFRDDEERKKKSIADILINGSKQQTPRIISVYYAQQPGVVD